MSSISRKIGLIKILGKILVRPIEICREEETSGNGSDKVCIGASLRIFFPKDVSLREINKKEAFLNKLEETLEGEISKRSARIT